MPFGASLMQKLGSVFLSAVSEPPSSHELTPIESYLGEHYIELRRAALHIRHADPAGFEATVSQVAENTPEYREWITTCENLSTKHEDPHIRSLGDASKIHTKMYTLYQKPVTTHLRAA